MGEKLSPAKASEARRGSRGSIDIREVPSAHRVTRSRLPKDGWSERTCSQRRSAVAGHAAATVKPRCTQKCGAPVGELGRRFVAMYNIKHVMYNI
jgi:hypothetical protein